jgi:hypothetical protein
VARDGAARTLGYARGLDCAGNATLRYAIVTGSRQLCVNASARLDAWPLAGDALGMDYNELETERWWPTCPEGNAQRLLEIAGYRVKGQDFIQALVLLTNEDNGVCAAPFAEYPDRVEVRVIACCRSPLGYSDAVDEQPKTAWPSNVWLDAPLGDRVVIDVDSGSPLRPFTLGRPNAAPGSFSLSLPVIGECAWIPIDEYDGPVSDDPLLFNVRIPESG